MGARSAVERLPEGVRKTLEGWLGDFQKGHLSLDEVMSRLEGQMAMAGLDPESGPSRSSVHRYGEKFAKMAERLKRSEQFASALATEVGPQIADGQGMKVLIQAFQSLAYDFLAVQDENTPLDAEGLMLFAKSLQAVAGAQKTDADRALKIEQETRKNAVKDVEAAAKSRGMSNETIDWIRDAVLGGKR
jgi:hypothetical protein